MYTHVHTHTHTHCYTVIDFYARELLTVLPRFKSDDEAMSLYNIFQLALYAHSVQGGIHNTQ